METIINFIERKLNASRKHPEYAKNFFAQAYGAMEYHCITHPEDESDLNCDWEETYYNAFNEIIYGGAQK